MLKKMMICAIVMAAHIPLCAIPQRTTIISNGDAYVITKYRTYVKLDRHNQPLYNQNGIPEWVTAKTYTQLQPNMTMDIPKHMCGEFIDIAIATKAGQVVLSKKSLYADTIVLEGRTCIIDGQLAQ